VPTKRIYPLYNIQFILFISIVVDPPYQFKTRAGSAVGALYLKISK
jgi:hypothetical protein